MDSKVSFSKRNNFEVIQQKEIIIRNDAPKSLRELIVSFVNYESKLSLNSEIFYDLIQTELQKPKYLINDWPEKIYTGILNSILDCEWYSIYNIIERIYENINYNEKPIFTEIINNHFLKEGIGWKVEDGKILKRGGDIDEYVQNELENEIKKFQY